MVARVSVHNVSYICLVFYEYNCIQTVLNGTMCKKKRQVKRDDRTMYWSCLIHDINKVFDEHEVEDSQRVDLDIHPLALFNHSCEHQAVVVVHDAPKRFRVHWRHPRLTKSYRRLNDSHSRSGISSDVALRSGQKSPGLPLGRVEEWDDERRTGAAPERNPFSRYAASR